MIGSPASPFRAATVRERWHTYFRTHANHFTNVGVYEEKALIV